jgi:hypothetical protein
MGGVVAIDFNHYDEDIHKSLKIIRGAISIFNAYKNKDFQAGVNNLPIVDTIINNMFKYKDSNNEDRTHPKGEVFVNE